MILAIARERGWDWPGTWAASAISAKAARVGRSSGPGVPEQCSRTCQTSWLSNVSSGNPWVSTQSAQAIAALCRSGSSAGLHRRRDARSRSWGTDAATGRRRRFLHVLLAAGLLFAPFGFGCVGMLEFGATSQHSSSRPDSHCTDAAGGVGATTSFSLVGLCDVGHQLFQKMAFECLVLFSLAAMRCLRVAAQRLARAMGRPEFSST